MTAEGNTPDPMTEAGERVARPMIAYLCGPTGCERVDTRPDADVIPLHQQAIR